MQNRYIESIANTVLLLLFFMAAVSYNGKLLGRKAEDLFKKNDETTVILPPAKSQLSQFGLSNSALQEKSRGVWTFGESAESGSIINTLAFSKGIYGFAGPVPMFLLLDENMQIQQIILDENNETPDFLKSIKEDGVIDQWLNKSPSEIMELKPDAISGATLTSNAINRSIQASISGISNAASTNQWYAFADLKTVAAILVLLSGLLISFRAKKSKKLRVIQLSLNTLVLGLWCGKFISLQTLLGWTSNGMNLLTSIVVFIMLLLALVMPLFFKKKAYYCTWVCPFGSAQELAGKLSKRKWHPGKKLMRILKHSQTAVTLSLFFCLWMGIATDIANYEPFSAFLFKHASPIVLSIAGVGLLVAIVTPRPWCRFVCPTGQVLNWANKM